MLGGGGGKFFTGSHAEGYTCQVCHTGATSPAVNLLGLPTGGYVPGVTYPITIDWDDDLTAVGLNLEVTDAAGNRFGELEAVDPARLSEADLCVGAQGVSAVEPIDLPGGRRVLTVAKCGQQQTSFLWTAPAQLGQAWLSGSVVSANRKKDVLGDGVTNISLGFAARGFASPQAGDLVATCSVRDPGTQRTDESLLASLFALSALSLSLRVRRKRAS
jgi:hypothetical protein